MVVVAAEVVDRLLVAVGVGVGVGVGVVVEADTSLAWASATVDAIRIEAICSGVITRPVARCTYQLLPCLSLLATHSPSVSSPSLSAPPAVAAAAPLAAAAAPPLAVPPGP